MKSINDCYILNNGVKIPCIGFGTYKAAEGSTSEIIREAVSCGYRYLDTASFYQTEKYVGEAIQESTLKREEFFIVSKVWKDDMGYDGTRKAFEKTLQNLRTEYLDLYLIHWPKPVWDYKEWRLLDRETWRAMETLYKEGRVKAIGLSNFLPHHIENILETGSVMPAVNQLEFHPGHTQEAAVRYCKEHGILVQAWSPLGRKRIMEDALIKELAGRYQVTAAQICLRYAIQKGVLPIPKASTKERMENNKDIFGFEISTEDMYRLDTMPPAGWSGEHPDRERVRPET